MNTRVLIICGGDGKRWNNHTGVPKHLLKIDGVPLLDRVIGQCRGVDDIVIICSTDDERYHRPGIELFVPPIDTSRVADVGSNSQPRWNLQGKTICLLGDVWFEDEGIDRVLKDDYQTFVMYGRSGASHVTGKPWAEDFACSFYPLDHADYLSLLSKHVNDTVTPWNHVAKGFQRIDNKPHKVCLYGLTEDFDYPHDLRIWLEMRDLHRNELNQTNVKTVGV